jgi:hypothetical protein
MNMRLVKALVLMTVLVVSMAAMAAESTKVTVSQPCTLNGTQIAPGDYKVTWDVAGGKAQVNITSGKKSVATSEAKVMERETANQYTAVVRDDSGMIKRVLVGGKKTVLVFSE